MNINNSLTFYFDYKFIFCQDFRVKIDKLDIRIMIQYNDVMFFLDRVTEIFIIIILPRHIVLNFCIYKYEI